MESIHPKVGKLETENVEEANIESQMSACPNGLFCSGCHSLLARISSPPCEQSSHVTYGFPDLYLSITSNWLWIMLCQPLHQNAFKPAASKLFGSRP